jgi:hypothetical protein
VAKITSVGEVISFEAVDNPVGSTGFPRASATPRIRRAHRKMTDVGGQGRQRSAKLLGSPPLVFASTAPPTVRGGVRQQCCTAAQRLWTTLWRLALDRWQDDGSSEPIWPFRMLQRASTARGSRVVDSFCGAVPRACVASAIRVLVKLRGLAVAAQARRVRGHARCEDPWACRLWNS